MEHFLPSFIHKFTYTRAHIRWHHTSTRTTLLLLFFITYIRPIFSVVLAFSPLFFPFRTSLSLSVTLLQCFLSNRPTFNQILIWWIFVLNFRNTPEMCCVLCVLIVFLWEKRANFELFKHLKCNEFVTSEPCSSKPQKMAQIWKWIYLIFIVSRRTKKWWIWKNCRIQYNFSRKPEEILNLRAFILFNRTLLFVIHHRNDNQIIIILIRYLNIFWLIFFWLIN